MLRNGIVHTVDDANPSAGAIAIRGGEIVYVGSSRGVDAWCGPATATIDLGGTEVYRAPGF